MNAEKARKVVEMQLKEMQNRLDQAETNALKGTKRIIENLENKVKIIQRTINSNIQTFSII